MVFKGEGLRVGIRHDSNVSAAGRGSSNPDRELRRLRRMELLEMLVDQIEENDVQTAQIEELSDLTERLKAKLDEKDAQIERLKEKLDDKDAIIRSLNAGVVPMVNLPVTFQALQEAVPNSEPIPIANPGIASQEMLQPVLEPIAMETYVPEFPTEIDFAPISFEPLEMPAAVEDDEPPAVSDAVPHDQKPIVLASATSKQPPIELPQHVIENERADDEARDPRLIWFLRR